MSALYRVFPYHAASAVDEPGGALHVPPQGGGRLANPDLYSVLYLSGAAPGAIAESFGRFPEWSQAILAGSPALPGSVRALARYQLDPSQAICDLDDPERLAALHLRPSSVVSRDYTRTRVWARTVYQQGIWSGISWWSFYDPRWSSIVLWDLSGLTLEDIHPLSLDDQALVEASQLIVRRIVYPRNIYPRNKH